MVKKTMLSAFKHLRKGGIRAISIEEGDDLVDVALTNGKYDILMSSAFGMACRFRESDVRAMGRTAKGVRGIRFKIKGDYLVSMLAIETGSMNGEDEQPSVVPESSQIDDDNAVELDNAADEDVAEEVDDEEITDIDELSEDEDSEEIGDDDGGAQILVISEGGMGKRSYISSYRLTRRGARGVLNMRLASGEKIIAVIQVEEGNDLLITTKGGQTVRIPTDEIRTVGRASKGVRIMRIKNVEKDSISGVTKVLKSEEEDSNENIAPGEADSENTTPENEQIQE